MSPHFGSVKLIRVPKVTKSTKANSAKKISYATIVTCVNLLSLQAMPLALDADSINSYNNNSSISVSSSNSTTSSANSNSGNAANVIPTTAEIEDALSAKGVDPLVDDPNLNSILNSNALTNPESDANSDFNSNLKSDLNSGMNSDANSDVNSDLNSGLNNTEKKTANKVTPQVVIGEENRKRMSDAKTPWISFGKIKFGKGNGWICSATLVGIRHVVTNSHCVDMKYPVYFYPSYNNGNFLDKTPYTTWAIHTYWGTGTSDTSSGKHTLPSNFSKESDWAVLVLNENAGTTFGWLGTKTWSDNWLNKPTWYNVSYPNAGDLNKSGEYPLFQNNCSVREKDTHYFYHDCDTNGGASGSALVGTWESKPYIIGLNNWQWGNGSACQPFKRGECSNGAVMTDSFIETLKKALKEYP